MKSNRFHFLVAGALAVLVLATLGVYVRFLFPARTRLVGGQIASSIDRYFVTPIDVTRRFTHTAPAIYVTATVSRAPLGTKIRASLHELTTQRQTSSFELVAVGTRNVGFEFLAGASGWTPGPYEIRLFLNGEETERLPFDVVTERAAR